MNSNEGSPNALSKEFFVFFCAHRDFVINNWWFLFSWRNSFLCFHCSCFSALCDTCSFSGKAVFSLSRRLFFSSGPLLLLLSCFLLCLGRTAAVCPAVENHGGGEIVVL